MRPTLLHTALLTLLLVAGGCDETPKPEIPSEAGPDGAIGAQSEQVQAPPMKRGVLKVGDQAPNFQ